MDKLFFPMVRHEIQSLLTIIIGYSELLDQNLSQQSPKEIGKKIAQAARRIEEIFFTFSTLDKETSISSFEPCFLVPLLQSVKGKLFSQMIEKIHIEGSSEVAISGNRSLLEIVFKNLLDNALKYGSSKGVSVVIKKTAKHALVEFINQSIGINHEDLQMLMAPFQRGKNSAGQVGMGLGLFIAKKIVEKYRGEISFHQKNEETKIVLSFPF
ncbi:MAG: HAMP domain-containing histidine kinase [Parachlamydiales bacterium]|nr:HAMP domain-containing histidine kinase [Parachlamydiales bacterium]